MSKHACEYFPIVPRIEAPHKGVEWEAHDIGRVRIQYEREAVTQAESARADNARHKRGVARGGDALQPTIRRAVEPSNQDLPP